MILLPSLYPAPCVQLPAPDPMLPRAVAALTQLLATTSWRVLDPAALQEARAVIKLATGRDIEE